MARPTIAVEKFWLIYDWLDDLIAPPSRHLSYVDDKKLFHAASRLKNNMVRHRRYAERDRQEAWHLYRLRTKGEVPLRRMQVAL